MDIETSKTNSVTFDISQIFVNLLMKNLCISTLGEDCVNEKLDYWVENKVTRKLELQKVTLQHAAVNNYRILMNQFALRTYGLTFLPKTRAADQNCKKTRDFMRKYVRKRMD